MRKARIAALSTQKQFNDELNRVLRRAARLRAALSGDGTVYEYWRSPYRGKKIRSYQGHWVRVVKLNKPIKAATKTTRVAASGSIH